MTVSLGLCGNAMCPGSGKNIFSLVIGKNLNYTARADTMTIFQSTHSVASSSKPADSSVVCKVTKEGAQRDWLPSKVTDFVFLELKKGHHWTTNLALHHRFGLGRDKGEKSFFLLVRI